MITYGDYDWSGQYQRLLHEAQAVQHHEPTIIREGDYADNIAIVRAGFARVSQAFGPGQKTIRYLGTGHIYGLDEMKTGPSSLKSQNVYQHTLNAVGYAHILFIRTSLIDEHIVRGAFSTLSFHAKEKSTLQYETSPTLSKHKGKRTKVPASLLEFFTDHRYITGTATMLIHLDKCTRCDDCVRACTATHGNNPRFLRQGPVHENVMVANACMHCVDPVCMLGCPTGAIHRDEIEGQVVINDVTCIGCGACANNCPYDAIRMVEISDGQKPVMNKDGFPVLKATKCDLCFDQKSGPACQRACPHDALKRVDMQELEKLFNWLTT
ncbi:MAG: 4Fe-4S dicluster domain-containing protein [Kiritimatiellae bacterium]|nr:4Fe-4S dicluster domain-containing protein [Kiritimatiellia bacterium]